MPCSDAQSHLSITCLDGAVFTRLRHSRRNRPWKIVLRSAPGRATAAWSHAPRGVHLIALREDSACASRARISPARSVARLESQPRRGATDLAKTDAPLTP